MSFFNNQLYHMPRKGHVIYSKVLEESGRGKANYFSHIFLS